MDRTNRTNRTNDAASHDRRFLRSTADVGRSGGQGGARECTEGTRPSNDAARRKQCATGRSKRGARDVYTASYLRKLTGVREWDIRQHCACRGYDDQLRELYSLAEVKRYLLGRRQERERRRLELELMKRRGLQLCRKCGAVVPYPGPYYCANPGCWPPSWRRRLERMLEGKAGRPKKEV